MNEIFNQIEQILSEIHEHDIESSIIISLRLSIILSLITRISVRTLLSSYETTIYSQHSLKVKKAMLYIHQNYMEKISIVSLQNIVV